MEVQHGQHQLKISLKRRGGLQDWGGSKYNEPSQLLTFQTFFLHNLGCWSIQGDLIVRHHSNVAWVREQKKEETNEFCRHGEVQVHM